MKDKKENKSEVEIKEVIVERKSGFNYAEVILIIIICLVLGFSCGMFVNKFVGSDTSNKHVTETNKKIPSQFDEFIETYNTLITNYYEKIDNKELINAGISGMLNYLDEYSTYMDPSISEEFNEQVEGKYDGIGVEIGSLTDKTVIVLRVFKDSPASKAGIKEGDIFKKVDDIDITGKTPSELSKLIRNKKNNFKLVLERDKKEVEFDLKNSNVNIDSVSSKVIEKNNKRVGYIAISIFASNTYEQFKKNLEELEKEKIDSLIIDVRGNSGGYLSSVTDMVSMFLPKNKIIYQLDTKGDIEKIYSKTKEERKYDVVVLIDKDSASASEILASALKESYNAKIVGVNSFGKGTVQTTYKLKNGATVKYTIQKWLTPLGNWINEKGVSPDIEVELDKNFFQDPKDENDNQLQKALEEITKNND